MSCHSAACSPENNQIVGSSAGLATATVLPVAVLNCAHFLDSAFDVACLRAKRAGKLLANMLMHRLHGDQPVTLFGVSVGARLAFHCCLELFKHGACALPLLFHCGLELFNHGACALPSLFSALAVSALLTERFVHSACALPLLALPFRLCVLRATSTVPLHSLRCSGLLPFLLSALHPLCLCTPSSWRLPFAAVSFCPCSSV